MLSVQLIETPQIWFFGSPLDFLMFYTLSEFPLRERKARKSQARERGKKEKMARIVGANYTDEASHRVHVCS